jgi:uncharacterized lipoprotein YehR (DUF1307 family)
MEIWDEIGNKKQCTKLLRQLRKFKFKSKAILKSTPEDTNPFWVIWLKAQEEQMKMINPLKVKDAYNILDAVLYKYDQLSRGHIKEKMIQIKETLESSFEKVSSIPKGICDGCNKEVSMQELQAFGNVRGAPPLLATKTGPRIILTLCKDCRGDSTKKEDGKWINSSHWQRSSSKTRRTGRKN